MRRLSVLSVILLYFLSVVLNNGQNFVVAWSNEEMEMYDLVEELAGENFYDALGVSSKASSKEIKSAYRKLSLTVHPDKVKEEDKEQASIKFRQLVGIYEVLKNTDLRNSYDEVLVSGLPNWRQPMFYFRRARKFAIWQVLIILITIVSVGQYLAGWASYFEQKLFVNEKIQGKRKKNLRTRKAQRAAPSESEVDAEVEKYLQKPSLYDTAPFQLYRLGKYMIFSMPGDVKTMYIEYKNQKEDEERQKKEEEEERLEEEKRLAEEVKKPKKRKVVEIPVKNDDDEEFEAKPTWGSDEPNDTQQVFKPKKVQISGGLWEDDDIAELAKLCSKFPGGTPDRWEKIADMLNRPVPEVTFMAKRVLEKLSQKATEEPEETQPKVKVKTKGGKAGTESDLKSIENWSAEEQKLLESALQMYPKGSLERWEKISAMIPSRNKDECMQRFKYVADLVKKKKEEKEKLDEENNQDQEVDSSQSQSQSSSVKEKEDKTISKSSSSSSISKTKLETKLVPEPEEIKQSQQQHQLESSEPSASVLIESAIRDEKLACLTEAQIDESSVESLRLSKEVEVEDEPPVERQLSNSSSSSDNDWVVLSGDDNSIDTSQQ